MIIDEKYRFWLTDEEVEKLRSHFPTPRGERRVDDKRVPSGIIFVLKTGCRWRDASDVYGPHRTLYTRWRRWSHKFWFVQMLRKMSQENEKLVKKNKEIGDVSMDATYCKVRPTEKIRIFDMHLTEGSASDYKRCGSSVRQIAQMGGAAFG